MAVDLILQILFPFLLQMFTGGVVFFVKIASSTTRCERKDKLYWYAGMRRMCANKQGELCEADTKGVDLRSGRESRTWPFPAEFETEQFSIDTSLCGRSEEGLLYNSLPRANPSPASAQNFWLCRRM